MCANTQLHQTWWALGAVTPALAVLLLEAVVALRVRPTRGWPLAATVTLLLLGLLVVACGLFVAPALGGLALVTLLTVRAGLRGAATWSQAPREVPLRLGALLIALGACGLSQRPSRRDPDELVRLLTATPYVFSDDSWALEELQRRRDEALPLVEARLESLRQGAGQRQLVVALELHQRLGGAQERRTASCVQAAASPAQEDSVTARRWRVCGASRP